MCCAMVRKFIRTARYHTVWSNAHGNILPHVPFGGIKSFGFGAELAEEGLEEYTPIQTERLAIHGPLTGVLFRDLLLPSGASIPATAGAELFYEADLQAVLHLRDEVRRRGEQLRPGDLLSLGTFTGLHPIQAGEQVTVTYSIPGEGVLQVQATFE